jgi:hypothetical protein
MIHDRFFGFKQTSFAFEKIVDFVSTVADNLIGIEFTELVTLNEILRISSLPS